MIRRITPWPWLKASATFLLLSFATLVFIFWRLDVSLRARLDRGWFLPPIEFYAAPETLAVGQSFAGKEFVDRLESWGWRHREAGLPLLVGDFALLTSQDCQRELPEAGWPSEVTTCLGFWAPGSDEPSWVLIEGDRIAAVASRTGGKRDKVSLPPERFAQYYEDQPLLRTVVDLGQVPLECSQAVTAIEDSEFLEHRGISPTAILRALGRNLSKARFAEGGSTITQQLVKNYFLSSEKTLKRKLVEQFLAVLLELRVDKDTILANYLNVIYMGQRGSFQVRGFAAAAEHYFGKPLSNLGLSDCALLAAIINNPGRYNPFRKPDSALARRNLVLSRMEQLNMINATTAGQAKAAPLGVRESHVLEEPAPYFVQATLEQIKNLRLNTESGLKIYTTLSVGLQAFAQKQVGLHLSELESRFPGLKREKGQQLLQGAVVVVDVATGGISAFVSGRDYRQSQFNRLIDSHRQPGSLFKPLVFLAALESGDYHKDTLIRDEPWTYRYEGQTWSPQNYDRKFRGDVRLIEALSQSLNVPTARLAIDVGLSSVIEVAHRIGIVSPLSSVPSLALGAAEVTPWEMAQAYLTLAKQGAKQSLNLVQTVTDGQDHVVYRAESETQQVVAPQVVEELVEMMRETFRSGTAQSIGRLHPSGDPAGKTGTTSDTKDTWFIGFNDKRLTLVWIGFDDNAPTEMTGAIAALPLWYKLEYF